MPRETAASVQTSTVEPGIDASKEVTSTTSEQPNLTDAVASAPAAAPVDPEYAAFQKWKAEQAEVNKKAAEQAAATLSPEQKEMQLHEKLEAAYGPGYVKTTKQVSNSEPFTSYWTAQAWDALPEDQDKDGKSLGTKGGHKKAIVVPDFVKNLHANAGVR